MTSQQLMNNLSENCEHFSVEKNKMIWPAVPMETVKKLNDQYERDEADGYKIPNQPRLWKLRPEEHYDIKLPAVIDKRISVCKKLDNTVHTTTGYLNQTYTEENGHGRFTNSYTSVALSTRAPSDTADLALIAAIPLTADMDKIRKRIDDIEHELLKLSAEGCSIMASLRDRTVNKDVDVAVAHPRSLTMTSDNLPASFGNLSGPALQEQEIFLLLDHLNFNVAIEQTHLNLRITQYPQEEFIQKYINWRRLRLGEPVNSRNILTHEDLIVDHPLVKGKKLLKARNYAMKPRLAERAVSFNRVARLSLIAKLRALKAKRVNDDNARTFKSCIANEIDEVKGLSQTAISMLAKLQDHTSNQETLEKEDVAMTLATMQGVSEFMAQGLADMKINLGPDEKLIAANVTLEAKKFNVNLSHATAALERTGNTFKEAMSDTMKGAMQLLTQMKSDVASVGQNLSKTISDTSLVQKAMVAIEKISSFIIFVYIASKSTVEQAAGVMIGWLLSSGLFSTCYKYLSGLLTWMRGLFTEEKQKDVEMNVIVDNKEFVGHAGEAETEAEVATSVFSLVTNIIAEAMNIGSDIKKEISTKNIKKFSTYVHGARDLGIMIRLVKDAIEYIRTEWLGLPPSDIAMAELKLRVESFVKDVCIELPKDMAKEIMTDHLYNHKILQLVKEANALKSELIKIEKVPMSILSTFNGVYISLMKYQDTVNAKTHEDLGRNEPLGIWMWGSPGLGKSVIVQLLIYRLYALKYPERAQKFRVNDQIYVRRAEMEFWNNYFGQYGCIFDDYFMNTDIDETTTHCIDYINVKNDVPFQLNMAELTEKKGTYFTSEVCISTNNMELKALTNATKLADVSAFFRRFDLNIRCFVNPEFIKNQNGAWIIDKEKVLDTFEHQIIPTEHCLFQVKGYRGFQKIHWPTGETFDNLVDFETLVKICWRKMQHLQKVKFGELIDKIAEKGLNLADGYEMLKDEMDLDMPTALKEQPEEIVDYKSIQDKAKAEKQEVEQLTLQSRKIVAQRIIDGVDRPKNRKSHQPSFKPQALSLTDYMVTSNNIAFYSELEVDAIMEVVAMFMNKTGNFQFAGARCTLIPEQSFQLMKAYSKNYPTYASIPLTDAQTVDLQTGRLGTIAVGKIFDKWLDTQLEFFPDSMMNLVFPSEHRAYITYAVPSSCGKWIHLHRGPSIEPLIEYFFKLVIRFMGGQSCIADMESLYQMIYECPLEGILEYSPDYEDPDYVMLDYMCNVHPKMGEIATNASRMVLNVVGDEMLPILRRQVESNFSAQMLKRLARWYIGAETNPVDEAKDTYTDVEKSQLVQHVGIEDAVKSLHSSGKSVTPDNLVVNAIETLQMGSDLESKLSKYENEEDKVMHHDVISDDITVEELTAVNLNKLREQLITPKTISDIKEIQAQLKPEPTYAEYSDLDDDQFDFTSDEEDWKKLQEMVEKEKLTTKNAHHNCRVASYLQSINRYGKQHLWTQDRIAFVAQAGATLLKNIEDQKVRLVKATTGWFDSITKQIDEIHAKYPWAKVLEITGLALGMLAAGYTIFSYFTSKGEHKFGSQTAFGSGDDKTQKVKWQRVQRKPMQKGQPMRGDQMFVANMSTEEFYAHSNKDPTATKIIEDVLVDQIGHIYWRERGGEGLNGKCDITFTHGRSGLTANHFFSFATAEFPDIYLTCSKGEFTFTKEQFTCTQLGTDLIAIEFDKMLPSFRDIRHHFAKITSATIDLSTVGFVRRKGDHAYTLVSHGNVNLGKNITYKIDEAGVNREVVTLTNYIRAGIPSVNGDCGSPLVIFNTHMNEKIGGILVAGSGSEALFHLVNPEDLYSTDFVAHFGQLVFPQGTTVLRTVPTTKAPRLPEVSKVIESKLHGKTGIASSTKPAKLKPFYIEKPDSTPIRVSPLQKALGKMERKPITVSDKMLRAIDKAADAVYNHLPQVPEGKKTKLNRFEAINGKPTWSHTGSIWFDTSNGWREDKPNPPGKSTKEHHFRCTCCGQKPSCECFTPNRKCKGHMSSYMPTPEMEKAIQDMKDILYNCVLTVEEKVKRINMVFQDCLKDERRDNEKVDEGKTRLFSAAITELLINKRELYQSFVEMMMSDPANSFSAMGINVHSQHWKLLYERLTTFSKVLAGDYSNYDASIREAINRAVEKVVARWHMENGVWDEKDLSAHKALWELTYRAQHVAGTTIYQMDEIGANPSGDLMTTVYNIIANAIIHVYCVIMEAWEQQIPGLVGEFQGEDYFKLFMLSIFGDDHVETTDVDWYDMQKKEKWIKTLGMTYTTTDKKSIGELRWQKIEDITYLKRRFVPKNGLVLAPLERHVIEDMPQWIKNNGNDPFQATTVNASAAVREMFHYGRDEFDFFRRRMEKLLRDNGCPPLHEKDYDELLHDYLGLGFVGQGDISYQDSWSMNDSTFVAQSGNERTTISSLKGFVKARPDVLDVVEVSQSWAICGEDASLDMRETDIKVAEFMEGRSQEIDDAAQARQLGLNPNDIVWNRQMYYAQRRANAIKEQHKMGNFVAQQKEIRLTVDQAERVLPITGRNEPRVLFMKIKKTTDVVKPFVGQMDANQRAPEEAATTESVGMTKFEDTTITSVEPTTTVPLIPANPYPDIDVGGILGRIQQIHRFSWTSAQTQHVSVSDCRFPKMLMDIPIISQTLKPYTFMRCKSVFMRCEINTTAFHHGTLLVMWSPFGPMDTIASDIFRGSSFPHVIISASAGNVVEFEIPWMLPTLYWNMKRGPTTSSAPDLFGHVKFMVLTPLKSMNATGTVSVDVNCYAYFKGAEVAGPNYPNYSMSEFKAQMNREQTTRSAVKTLAAIAEATGPIVATITGVPQASGIAKQIVKAISGSEFNNPTTVQGVTFTQDRQDSLQFVKGLSNAQKLSADPQNAVSCDHRYYGDKEDYNILSNYCMLPTVFKLFSFTNSSLTKSLLASWRVHPLVCPSSTDSETGDIVATPTHLANAACNFELWNGPIRYRISFVTSKFITARVRIVWTPEVYSSDEDTAGSGSVYSKVIDITGETNVDIEIPYFNEKIWSRVFPSGISMGMVPSIDHCSGQVSIFLVNPVKNVNSSADSVVDCVIWTAAGPGMRFTRIANRVPYDAIIMDSDIASDKFHAQSSYDTRAMFRGDFETLAPATTFIYQNLANGDSVNSWKELITRPNRVGLTYWTHNNSGSDYLEPHTVDWKQEMHDFTTYSIYTVSNAAACDPRMNTVYRTFKFYKGSMRYIFKKIYQYSSTTTNGHGYEGWDVLFENFSPDMEENETLPYSQPNPHALWNPDTQLYGVVEIPYENEFHVQSWALGGMYERWQSVKIAAGWRYNEVNTTEHGAYHTWISPGDDFTFGFPIAPPQRLTYGDLAQNIKVKKSLDAAFTKNAKSKTTPEGETRELNRRVKNLNLRSTNDLSGGQQP